MSSYPPPLQILPTFNKDEFDYASDNLSYTTADARYLKLINGMTLNTDQTVSAQKTFSNIQTFTTTNGVPGGQAINITSLFGGNQTRLYSVNSSYSTDLYFPQFNGTDTLVSTASTATLTNKTLSAPTITGTVSCSQFQVNHLTGNSKLPSTSGSGNSLGTITLNGGRLVVSFTYSAYLTIAGGNNTFTLNLVNGGTTLTVSTGTKSVQVAFNVANLHQAVCGINYSVASGYTTGTYTAYLYSPSITNMSSDQNDPYALQIIEFPIA